jgi:hypothetical protein
MRGTDNLIAEQRPNPFQKKRRRKRKGRAQPFRRGSGREKGPTLDAMVKGAPAFLPNPQDAKRAAQKRSRRR